MFLFCGFSGAVRRRDNLRKGRLIWKKYLQRILWFHFKSLLKIAEFQQKNDLFENQLLCHVQWRHENVWVFYTFKLTQDVLKEPNRPSIRYSSTLHNSPSKSYQSPHRVYTSPQRTRANIQHNRFKADPSHFSGQTQPPNQPFTNQSSPRKRKRVLRKHNPKSKISVFFFAWLTWNLQVSQRLFFAQEMGSDWKGDTSYILYGQ